MGMLNEADIWQMSGRYRYAGCDFHWPSRPAMLKFWLYMYVYQLSREVLVLDILAVYGDQNMIERGRKELRAHRDEISISAFPR